MQQKATDDFLFKVFVSYSTADMETVEMVRRWSTDPRVEVFIAEHSIAAGEPLASTIIEAIQTCDLFLLLWSAGPAKSDYVKQEVGVAVGNKRPILPVVLGDDAPALPALISGTKYIDAPRYPSEWLLTVQQRLNEMASAKQISTSKPAERRLSAAEVALIAAVIVIVVVLLIVALNA